MSRVPGSLLPVVSASAAVLALALTLHTLQNTPEWTRQIRRKSSDLLALANLRHDQSGPMESMRLLEQGGQSTSLQDVMGQAKVAVEERPDENLVNGWLLKSASLHFEEAELEGLAGVLSVLEGARPPWRVASLEVLAGGEPGRGRASLSVESIWKKP